MGEGEGDADADVNTNANAEKSVARAQQHQAKVNLMDTHRRLLAAAPVLSFGMENPSPAQHKNKDKDKLKDKNEDEDHDESMGSRCDNNKHNKQNVNHTHKKTHSGGSTTTGSEEERDEAHNDDEASAGFSMKIIHVENAEEEFGEKARKGDLEVLFLFIFSPVSKFYNKIPPTRE
jgi:hypothetical protein